MALCALKPLDLVRDVKELCGLSAVCKRRDLDEAQSSKAEVGEARTRPPPRQ